MGLSWRLDAIENHETVCWHVVPDGQELSAWATWFVDETDGLRREMEPVTYALIMSTLSTGIGEITADNVHDVYTRVHALQTAYGAMLHGTDPESGKLTDVPLTVDDIRRHVGLSTNVFPRRSDEEFARQIMGALRDNAGRAWKEQTGEAMPPRIGDRWTDGNMDCRATKGEQSCTLPFTHSGAHRDWDGRNFYADTEDDEYDEYDDDEE